MSAALRLIDVCKTFVLHHQGGARLAVLDRLSLEVDAGTCVALVGRSGLGKSTALRIAYGNYGADSGQVLVHAGGQTVYVARAVPRQIMRLRRDTIGHVSQFLRVIPRVPTLQIVSDAARRAGASETHARRRAQDVLEKLNIPAALWPLPPTTFSGGEQQRVNLARVLVVPFPVLLLDEPTASLDRDNRAAAVSLIDEARRRGAAILGIFHDG